MKRLHRPSPPVLWTATLATISVLYMAFALPLGRGSDEIQHIYRAYQVSLGQWFPQVVHCTTHPLLRACVDRAPHRFDPSRRVGGDVPNALLRVYSAIFSWHTGYRGNFHPVVYSRQIGVDLGGPATVYVHFENTALYSPVNYIPAAVAFWLGRAFSASVIWTVFAARLLTGFVWVGMVTGAVALVPRWKWQFSFAVLVPTALALSSMIAADAASLGFAALTIAYALRLADRAAPPGRAQIACLSGLCLLVGLLKAPLPLLVVAVAVILWPVLGGGRARLARLAAIVVPAGAIATWWMLSIDAYFVPYRDLALRPALRMFVSPARQFHHLLTHLTAAPLLFWHSALHGELFAFNGIVGSIGQNGQGGPLPEGLAIAWLAAFVILVIVGREGAPSSRRLRLWLFGLLGAYLVLTAFALYLTWTTVGSGAIEGIQGRYFTPMLVLVVPLLAGLGARRLTLSQRAVGRIVMLLSALGALAVFFRVSQYYYSEEPWQVIHHVAGVLL